MKYRSTPAGESHFPFCWLFKRGNIYVGDQWNFKPMEVYLPPWTQKRLIAFCDQLFCGLTKRLEDKTALVVPSEFKEFTRAFMLGIGSTYLFSLIPLVLRIGNRTGSGDPYQPFPLDTLYRRDGGSIPWKTDRRTPWYFLGALLSLRGGESEQRAALVEQNEAG